MDSSSAGTQRGHVKRDRCLIAGRARASWSAVPAFGSVVARNSQGIRPYRGRSVVSKRVVSTGGAQAAPRRFLIVATNEGGGDIQPLLAITAGLLARGHHVTAFGDAAVPPKMAPLGISTIVVPPELALGAAIADRAREVGHRPLEAQAEWLRDRQVAWAERLAPAIEEAAEAERAEVLVGGQFGSGAISLAARRSDCRGWA